MGDPHPTLPAWDLSLKSGRLGPLSSQTGDIVRSSQKVFRVTTGSCLSQLRAHQGPLICYVIQFSSVGIEANRGQSLGKHKSISGQTTALQQQLDAVQFTLYSDLCSLIKFLKSWCVQFLGQTVFNVYYTKEIRTFYL